MIDVKVEDSGLNINVSIEGSGPTGAPGKSPYVGENGHWFEWQDGEYVDTGKVAEGRDGDDGVSPTVEVTQTETGHKVVITDKDGEKSFDVSNGQNGEDGEDGVSPTITVEDVEGGHKVIITGKDGPKEFVVPNGKNGDPGDPGENGQTPSITIGTVETLPSDSPAKAEIVGQTPNLTLNMGIPKGPKGDPGSGGESRKLIARYTHTANGSIKLSDLDMETGVFTCSEPHNITEGKAMYFRPLTGCKPTNVPIEIPTSNPNQWGRGRLKAHVLNETQFQLYKTSADEPLAYTSEYNTYVDISRFTFEYDLKNIAIQNIWSNDIEIYAYGDITGGYLTNEIRLGKQGDLKVETVLMTEESPEQGGNFLDGSFGQVAKTISFYGKVTFRDGFLNGIFDYTAFMLDIGRYVQNPENVAFKSIGLRKTSAIAGYANHRGRRRNTQSPPEVNSISSFYPVSWEAAPYNGFYLEIWGGGV